MNWIVLVVVAVLTDALRMFIDNYTSDVYFNGRSAAAQKVFYGYAGTFIALLFMAILHPDLSNVPFFVPLCLFIAGFLTSLSGVPYYRALEIDDSTNIGIFVQLAPILYLVLGWFFLGETFSPLQLIAFIVILAAPLLIILTTRKRSRKIKIKAAGFAFLYVFIAVVANLIFVKTADVSPLNFFENMIFIYFGKGIGNLILVTLRPKWRKRFKDVFKKSHRKVLIPLAANSAIGLVKDLSYRGALIFAPAVAIASVFADSATPIAIFFLGIVLTLIWPKFGREKLNRKAVLIHLIATIFVVIGIILLQI